MYTTACFIRKNTKELRDKLGSITGTERWLFSLRNGYGNYIIHNQYIDSSDNSVEDNKCDLIDCGDNEELFLAIAALRDDSNDKQFFICTESDEETELLKGEFRLYEDCLFHYEDGDIVFPAYYWKKATVNELIEHFKEL